ncbi:MAG: DUF4476 domain-containing protein [Cryomorphaceae bacterium]
MKKVIPFIAMLFAVVATASAFPYGSSALEINVSEFGHFTIEVNGRAYQTTNGTLNLDRLTAGNYDVRVIKHEQRGRGYGARVHNRVLYRGNVFVPHNTRMQGRIDRYGMHFQPVSQARARHGVVRSHGPASPAMYNAGPRDMHPAAFDGLMQSMRSTPFDRTRMEIACAAVQNNYVSTRQIADMMRAFTFDRYKLEIAKLAYQSCVDRENYFILAQEFTFDSNARELMRYIH